ncbi:MAG: helix-turn-helix domain-containing protein [Phycisphaerales bacterium]
MSRARPTKTRRTADALVILDRITGSSRRVREMIEREKANVVIAQQIYDARTEAGLSQAELARLIGTTQSVIARLEDADYRGHSLSMLRRIAAALGREVEVRLVARRVA